jgi:hypothetical protein
MVRIWCCTAVVLASDAVGKGTCKNVSISTLMQRLNEGNTKEFGQILHTLGVWGIGVFIGLTLHGYICMESGNSTTLMVPK